jgi:hypothetical protein
MSAKKGASTGVRRGTDRLLISYQNWWNPFEREFAFTRFRSSPITMPMRPSNVWAHCTASDFPQLLYMVAVIMIRATE